MEMTARQGLHIVCNLTNYKSFYTNKEISEIPESICVHIFRCQNAFNYLVLKDIFNRF